MSLAFSNTTTKGGILQLIERNVKLGDGGITGNATRLAEFTSDVNLALDDVLSTIFEVGGTWQFDDSNHTDYPIITTNIVSGQRDYTFVTDEQGNLILDIYKVMVADEQGNFSEIIPVDQQSRLSPPGYNDGNNTTGLPNTYDKTANGIFLDAIPNYNRTGGLKVFINREGSYFATTDTTKKPGFAGLFHEYLALRPSYQYAYRNGLENTKLLKQEMLEMEDKIRNYYKAREKDVQKTLQARSNNAH